MSNAVIALEKQTVAISGESYNIATIPSATSALVLETRTRLLGEMKLDDLLRNLNLVGKLLFVAYNGVAAQPELRGQISTLQVEYMSLCARSQQAMLGFETTSRVILNHLKSLFNYLLAGEEDTALLYLTYIAKSTDEMATIATELKASFDGLFVQATKALAGAETAKGTEEEKQKQYEAAKADFEAKSEHQRVITEAIAKSKIQLQQLYEEAKAAAEKHEDRAFALAIVGAIMKPLGEGLGAFAGAMANSKIPISLPTAPPAAPKETTTPPKKEPVTTNEEVSEAKAEAEAAKKKAEEAEESAETAKAAATEAQDKAKTAKEKAEKADEADAEAAEEEAEAAEAEATEAVEASEEAEEEAEEAKQESDKAAEKYRLLFAALTGIGKSISSAGEGITEIGKSYAEIASEYNKEKQFYLNKLLEEQKAEREALANIAEYAKRMQQLAGQVEVAALVIDALHQAVGALKQIVVILSNASDLWRQMASHCKELSTSTGTIKGRIELWKKKKNRLELYLGPDFVTDVVTYYADWKALEIVSKEYSVAANNVKLEVQGNIVKNIRSEDMLKLAIEEGKVLLKSTNEGITNLNNEQQAIQNELTALESASAQNA